MRWLLLIALAVVNAEETCLSGEEDPYLLFGTKTAYTFASKGIPNNRVHDVLGCQPVAIYLLNRHGSHNPEANETYALQALNDLKNNVATNYRNGNYRDTNQRMCPADVGLLERWSWSAPNASFSGDVTSDGYLSAQQLAQAYRHRYPQLFTDNRHDYLFKFPNDRRSSVTFKAFTEGLFRDQAESYDLPKEIVEPAYLKCPAWEKLDTMTQKQIFESKQEYKEMITNISLRLGFNYDIQEDTVKAIYNMCRYNKAWNVVQISAWCAAFSRDDLRRLEYAEDLETYYKYGYGTPQNQDLGCAYVKEIIDFFTKHVDQSQPQQPKTVVQLGSAASVLLALSALGARRDAAPLTGDAYHTRQAQARRWASSTMAPFNANVAVVLYKCSLSGNFQIKDQYQVLFLENEQEISMENCRIGLCDWSEVKRKFGEVASKCDLKFCNGASGVNHLVAVSLAAVAFIVRLVV